MSASTIVPWVIGNWKMNPATADVQKWTQQFNQCLQLAPIAQQQCNIAIAPTYLSLISLKDTFVGYNRTVHVVAQDVSRFPGTGAYTGDVSAQLLQDARVSYVLVGHSERRELLGDNTEILCAKIKHALEAGLTVVYCVGESLTQRENGEAEAVVLQQVKDIASVVNPQQWEERIIIAYEPIWAIGTGKTASADDAQAMHAQIRAGLSQITDASDRVAILYGGSVKPENAADFAACPDINGALVGGASLNAASFYKIAASFAGKK
ncbi:triose-phosphate isomerase [Acinetobacter sp. B5B]|uniref:triose-phosphate isomerase n=1 Tax=Acinetobacter baretiae TaxID=2605383 RepID=UPI0018C1FC58|nr:triose-phosphate isomerase [Acinetobacter baretiae]MBF7682801.1 triose-phosphate isomerase [Acinetobacter baretiae]MBF7686295.1 triose-phosphate isomerase [Acinetobacter baretiae]